MHCNLNGIEGHHDPISQREKGQHYIFICQGNSKKVYILSIDNQLDTSELKVPQGLE